MRTVICAILMLGILLLGGVMGVAQDERSLEDRLIAFTHQLRMGLTLSTVAAHSPTIVDLRLHAQQLINLLEGVDGDHFVRLAAASELPTGLIVELAAMRTRIDAASPATEVRPLVLTAIKNVRTYLDLALSATLDGIAQRRLDLASADMLRVYAFLLAAYEKPCDAAYVPALWTILRAYDLAGRVGANEEE